MTVAAVSITEHWHELVTVALLGTDRREPSPAPPLLADVIDDALGDTAADRLLTAVAAAVVARRVGVRPGRGAAPLQTAPIDRRPVLPVAARPTMGPRHHRVAGPRGRVLGHRSPPRMAPAARRPGRSAASPPS